MKKYIVNKAYLDTNTWQDVEVGDIVKLTEKRYKEIIAKRGKDALTLLDEKANKEKVKEVE